MKSTPLHYQKWILTLLCLFAIATNAQQPKNGVRKIGIGYYLEHLSTPTSFNWHIVSAETNIRVGSLTNAPWAILAPRINMGQRSGNGTTLFQNPALQGQLDAYLTLSKKITFFTNYGYSSSSKFAKHQAALEGTFTLNHGWAATAGVKLTSWDNVAMGYMVGVDKYIQRWWISLRPMLVVQEAKSFAAIRAGIRYYISEPNSYLHCGLSYGNSPELANFRPDLRQILSLRSFGGYISWQQPLSQRLLIHVAIAYRQEEYKQETWRDVIGAGAGVIYLLP